MQRSKEQSGNCHCRACVRDFGSLAAFDAHRTGDPTARRCRTEDEMVARGMHRDGRDRWRCAGSPESFLRTRVRPATARKGADEAHGKSTAN